MSKTSPVILILGSGPNIGRSVARVFAAKGYKVALASRKAGAEDAGPGQVQFQSDLSDPKSLANLFSNVKASLGIPSVVVYNGIYDILWSRMYQVTDNW